MSLIVSKARMETQIETNKVPIQLNECSATQLDPQELTKQLNDLGLHCSQTFGENLKNNIEEVTSKIGLGCLTTFGVYKDNGEIRVEQLSNDVMESICSKNTLNKLLEERFEKEANGLWEEEGAGQYTPKLQVLQQIDNFNYLKEHAENFPYAEQPEKEIEQEATTADAIKEMFTEAACACTAVTVQGIDKTTLNATFSNALVGLNESALTKDYDVTNNRVITLLYNYNPKTKECDGVGIVTCNWHLQIKNYKKKKKKELKNKTTLKISARSVLYN
ncbi:MAG: hypothetical protein K2K42_05300, partial [Eubacterium sp.]|nr:hypothetical protein [Eubacterium sp.]